MLRTDVDGIWALGECNGRGAFTHTAYNDFEIIAANLLDGECRSLKMRVQGYAVYTDPPLVRAGMTEARSEEHTSELQSLMRISYAVFCLTKKHHTYITKSANEQRI